MTLCKISGGRFENFYTSDGLCGNEFSGNAASLSCDGATLPLGKDHLKPSEIVELTANEPTGQEVDIAAEEPTQEEVVAQENALQADGPTTATPDATMIYIAEDVCGSC